MSFVGVVGSMPRMDYEVSIVGTYWGCQQESPPYPFNHSIIRPFIQSVVPFVQSFNHVMRGADGWRLNQIGLRQQM